MQEACKYFKMTDLHIYEVSKKLGYQDPYYFPRIFKKIIGISPRIIVISREFLTKTILPLPII